MVGVVEKVGGSGRVYCVCVNLNERVKGEEVARIGLWALQFISIAAFYDILAIF